MRQRAGASEEMERHTSPQMLEDSSGRSVFIGDAATLSFLQLLRMMVESDMGPCEFTNDPNAREIVETRFKLPPDTCLNHQLPEYQTAKVLVDSFFVNVSIRAAYFAL